jgi:hypothetical protein
MGIIGRPLASIIEEEARMKSKITKIALDGFGSYLGMEKGCFIVRDKGGKEERYPLFESEIGEHGSGAVVK